MGRGVSISIISTTMVPTPARRRAIPPTQTDRGSAARHPNHRRSWSCHSGPVASRADAARGPRETGQRVSLANETLSPRCYNRTLASRPVPHAAKQARFNADADRCTQNTRMGLSPAWPFTAAAAASLPGEPRWCGSPCPICVFCVDLPASALNPCLLASPRAARRCDEPRPPLEAEPAAKAPCTCTNCPTSVDHRLTQSTTTRWRDSPGLPSVCYL
jgi:hypothetical protein